MLYWISLGGIVLINELILHKCVVDTNDKNLAGILEALRIDVTGYMFGAA